MKLIFGKKESITNFEIFRGGQEYAKSFNFFWLRDLNIIEDPLFVNNGVNYTVKGLDTGTYYLLTVVDDEVGENTDS